ncbi:MAG: MaoC/PaaZ C-terminal domain-containing protein [Chloroflexota bacterium]
MSVVSTVYDRRYYEDFQLGEVFETAARTVTESDVMLYAGLTGDYHPNHTDDETARRGAFGARVAHGLLVIGIANGLLYRCGLLDPSSLALLGVTWRFRAPVKLGDTVRVRMRISEMRPTSKPDRGIVTRAVQVVNQNGVVISEGDLTSMIRRDPARSASQEVEE